MDHDRNNGADTELPARPGTFRPGNPGRPAGARNGATLAAMALLEGEAEALTRRCVEVTLAHMVAVGEAMGEEGLFTIGACGRGRS
jgi:hypothetical protein